MNLDPQMPEIITIKEKPIWPYPPFHGNVTFFSIPKSEQKQIYKFIECNAIFNPPP